MRGTRVCTPGRPPAGRPRWLSAVVVAIALLSLACEQGPVLRADGRLQHREHGYSIADPVAEGGGWRPMDVKSAEFAFRDGRGGSMTMLRECRGGAAPRLLARQLRIGIEGSNGSVTDSRAVQLRGDAGWAQTFSAVEDDREVRLRSVTLSADLCTYDWVLVGAGDAKREAAFDRWWSSFVRADAPGGTRAGDSR